MIRQANKQTERWIRLIGFLPSLFCAVAGCRPNTESTIVIEAESFNGTHEVGNATISVASIGSCNDGNVLVGLDRSGEYVEYAVRIPYATDYGLVLVGRGEVGKVYRLVLKVAGRLHTGSAEASFQFLGSGFG